MEEDRGVRASAPPLPAPLSSGLRKRMLRAWTRRAEEPEPPPAPPPGDAPAPPTHTPAGPQMAAHTYEGNAGGQEKDPHQEVFKLLYHQLPQGLPWGKRQARGSPGLKSGG